MAVPATIHNFAVENRENDPAADVRLIPVGFVNNRSAEGRLQGKNWKCDTTTDPEVFWVKP